MVLCTEIANQCLKGCLNLGLTSFPSPVSIRAYVRSDKAFCLVNSNTFCAFFNGQEKAAMCFDSYITGPPSLFTYVSKCAYFSRLATRLQKLSNLWHPLNVAIVFGLNYCFQVYCFETLLPDQSQSSYSDTSQIPFQPILFLNCGLIKSRSKHMMITHLSEGFDQAFVVSKSIFLLLLWLLKLQFSLIMLQFLLFFSHFLRKKITLAGTKAERLSKRQP